MSEQASVTNIYNEAPKPYDQDEDLPRRPKQNVSVTGLVLGVAFVAWAIVMMLASTIIVVEFALAALGK